MTEGENPEKQGLGTRADELIKAASDAGLLPLDGNLEAAVAVRNRTIAFLEQSDRYPKDRLVMFGSEGWLEAYVAEMERNPEQEFITLIRIIDVPKGDAPMAIRRQWVGRVLFTVQRDPETMFTTSVRDSRDQLPPELGYIVDRELAVSTLRNDGLVAAADWWDDLYRGRDDEERWVFDCECAEPITLDNLETA